MRSVTIVRHWPVKSSTHPPLFWVVRPSFCHDDDDDDGWCVFRSVVVVVV